MTTGKNEICYNDKEGELLRALKNVMNTTFIKRWNILRARRVFHCDRTYTFYFPHDFHPRLSIEAPSIEIASLLYVEAVQLLKEIFEDGLKIRREDIKKYNGRENAVLNIKPNLAIAPGAITKYFERRHAVSHDGAVVDSVQELDAILDDISNILVQLQYVPTKPDINEFVWFISQIAEPIKGKVSYIITGSYGVQVAKTAKPVYFYTFEVHYKDVECTKQISQYWSKLKTDF